MPEASPGQDRLDAMRREQTPQALARLVVVGLFIALWILLWVAHIGMPLPFLAVLCVEAVFFVVYWRTVFLLPTERAVRNAHYAMLAAEILFHTTMVYFLGGITWLGAFAYVFGLIFTNTFLDLRRGLVYTTGAASALVALTLLDATGAIPHYTYLAQGPLRYSDPRFVTTTVIGATGVFFSIYFWVNWVGLQLRTERDAAVAAHELLVGARTELQRNNAELERRVRERTGELEFANGALLASEELLRSTIESTADGILVVDSAGNVAHANQRFAEMWRIPGELLSARNDERLLQFVVDQLREPDVFLSKVQELYRSDREDLDTLLFKDGRVFERYSRPLLRDAVGVDGRVWSFRDITERKRAENALLVSEHSFKLLFAANPHPMWVFDRETLGFIEVNPAAMRHYGYSRDEFLAMSICDIRPAERIAPLEDQMASRNGPQSEGEWRHVLKSGAVIDVHIRAHDIEFAGHEAVLVVSEDITERKRAEEARERLTAIVEATTDLVSILDAEGRRLYLNRAGRRMLGFGEHDDISATTILDNRPDWAAETITREAWPAALRSGVWVSESAYLGRDGQEIPVSEVMLAHRSSDGSIDFASVIARDMSERKRFEAELVHLANRDPLTGLFNRRRFNEEMEHLLSQAQRYGVHGALLFLDLDQFKDVNDSLGHRAGDDLLTNLAQLLRGRLRETDIIARFGGDEFAILLPHTEATDACDLAGHLLETVRDHPFLVRGGPLRISCSIGIALFPAHGTSSGELLSRADLAMYRAKEEGRNRYSLFQPDGDWQAQIESRLGWQQRVREALEHDRFVLLAQPILDLRSDRVTQYELLLRMVDLDGELILPGLFLDIAERTGLIQDIDRWVVRKAIRLIADYRDRDLDLRLEVNLSGKAFSDPELLPLIQGELIATGIDPSSLVLEVTETAAIANLEEAQRFVRTLKGMGCGFALDDFGVGFSSFSHLKHLPVDYLKIDGSFVRDLPRNEVDQQLVKAIVGVARGLGKMTIAEFVGDADTVALLKEYGIDYAQGFHISEPHPLQQIVIDRQAA